MFGRTRHRVRGKPFKLFSDELPNVEFGDEEKKAAFKDTEEGNKARFNKKRTQSFNDRLSLPSLGTPERDDAFLTISDSRISSSQSGNQTVLSPYLQELHDRIRLRHPLRENTQHAQPRWVPKRSTTLKLDQDERPTVIKREKFPGRGMFEDKKKDGTIETHFYMYENIFTGDFGNLDNKSQSGDKFRKPESLLQQLLDASARDFSRRKQINDGLIPNSVDSLYRAPSGRASSKELRRRETAYPSEGTATPVLKNEYKPGILKREFNKDRVSVQVPSMCIPQGNSPKPRLVHNEHLNSHVDQRYEQGKQKRVYFTDDEDYPLGIAEAENSDKIDSLFRPNGSHRKARRYRKSSRYPTEEVEIKFESFVDRFDDDGHNKRTRNGRELYSTQSTKTWGKKGGRSRQISPYLEKEIRDDAVDLGNYDSTSDVTNNDFLLGNMFPADDHRSAFHTSSARRGLHFNVEGKDRQLEKLETVSSHEMKPHTPNSYPSFLDQIKAESKNGERNDTPNSGRLRRTHSERIGRPLNIPPLILPHGNSAHINEHFVGSRNPEAVGLDELQDDFDLSELPEDIDRSLDGVELIKAYRLWDRERKAFPSGLRKIDIPFDPRDFILSKLRSSHSKPQRTTQIQKPEVKVTLV